jgi:hypothetical protein
MYINTLFNRFSMHYQLEFLQVKDRLYTITMYMHELLLIVNVVAIEQANIFMHYINDYSLSFRTGCIIVSWMEQR